MLNIHCLYSCVSMAYFIIKYLKIITAMRFLNDCYILEYSDIANRLVVSGMLYKFLSLTLNQDNKALH